MNGPGKSKLSFFFVQSPQSLKVFGSLSFFSDVFAQAEYLYISVNMWSNSLASQPHCVYDVPNTLLFFPPLPTPRKMRGSDMSSQF